MLRIHITQYQKNHIILLKNEQRTRIGIFFPKESIPMTNRHRKICSTSLIIREMQTKTTMRYHLTLVRTTVIKKTRKHKYWWGCGEKVTPIYYWWECKFVQPLEKTVWSFLKKLKIELPYNPAIPLLGIYPKKYKNTNLKKYVYPKLHRSIIYNSQDMEAT